MEEARAFSPCHVTGFFQIFDEPVDSLYAGSIGAGFSIAYGVETTVRAARASEKSLEVRINGSVLGSTEVSHHLISSFLARFTKIRRFKITVDHSIDVPIGVGFGTSGAASLSLALALNDLFDLELSKNEAAQLAHITEVECNTGLGTVIAESLGGLEVRVKPGAPGIGEVKSVPVPDGHVAACVAFGALPTKKVLSNELVRARVNKFGGEFVRKLVEMPNLETFLNLSRQFAEETGLITDRTRRVLNATDDAGFVCSMPMFGESIFTLVEKEHAEEIVKVFRKHDAKGKVLVSNIDFEGARLMNDED